MTEDADVRSFFEREIPALLDSLCGAALRLLPWYAEDRIKTPFYDSVPVAQGVSALFFVGLCAYLWFNSVREVKEE